MRRRLLHHVIEAGAALVDQRLHRVALVAHRVQPRLDRALDILLGRKGRKEQAILLLLQALPLDLVAFAEDPLGQQGALFSGRCPGNPFGQQTFFGQPIVLVLHPLGREGLAVVHVAIVVDPLVDGLRQRDGRGKHHKEHGRES